jgi:hypothetical protein
MHLILFVSSAEAVGASWDFSVADPARWPSVSSSAPDFGSHIYKYRGTGSNQFVVTRVLKVHEKTFSRSLETSLDEVQAERSRFLQIFGITRYSIINHEKLKSSMSGFKTVDVLHSQYNDPSGNVRHAIEFQYVRSSKAYIVTYVSEARSLSDADLDRINKILLQFHPLIHFSKLHALNNLMDWLIDGAEAEVVSSSSSGTTPMVYTAGAPLPSYCKDVPAEDKRGPNEAEIQPKLDSASWEDCKSNLKKGASEILDTLNKIDRATGPDRIEGTLEQAGAAVGSLAAAFYNNPNGMWNSFTSGIVNLAKKTAMSGVEITQCLNANAIQKRLCKALPGLVAGGALGKLAAGGKVAIEGADEVTAALAKAPKVESKVAKLGDAVEIDGIAHSPVVASDSSDTLSKVASNMEEKNGVKTYVRAFSESEKGYAYASEDADGKPYMVFQRSTLENPETDANVIAHEATHVSNSLRAADNQDLGAARTVEFNTASSSLGDSQVLSSITGYSTHMRIDEIHARAVESGVSINRAQQAISDGDLNSARTYLWSAKNAIKTGREMQTNSARILNKALENAHDVVYDKSSGKVEILVEMKTPRTKAQIQKIKEMLAKLPDVQYSENNENSIYITVKVGSNFSADGARIRANALLEQALIKNNFDAAFENNLSKYNLLNSQLGSNALPAD